MGYYCVRWEDVYGWETTSAPSWNAGAYFRDVLEGDGYFTVQVAPDAVGVAIGLTYDHTTNGYNRITHGFLFLKELVALLRTA